MTTQSSQQDGDGYYGCSLPPGACECSQSLRHKCSHAHWIDNQPARDAAEGAEPSRDDIIRAAAGEPVNALFAMTSGEKRAFVEPSLFAPPKPAIDAVRVAWDRTETVIERSLNCHWIAVLDREQFKKNLRIAFDTEVEAGGPYLNNGWNRSASVPPADDGLRETRIAKASALARRLCQLFDSGGESQRTARARHASAIFQLLGSDDAEQRKCDMDPVCYLERCERLARRSPSGAGAAEPVARCHVCDWPMATDQAKGCVPGDCAYRPDDPAEQERIRKRRVELAAPPVRGDREAIARIIDPIAFTALERSYLVPEHDEFIRMKAARDKADAIISLPFNPMRVRR